MEGATWALLPDSDSESEVVENYDLLSILALAHDAISEALEAQQASHQPKKPLLNISDTLAEALGLISACTEIAFRFS